MYSLGVDVGGTFIKVALLEGGLAMDTHRVPMPGFLRPFSSEAKDLGSREIDPIELDHAVNCALRMVGTGAGFDGRIFVSGQMAGLAFVDATGAALAPLISWQDRRYTNVRPVIDALGGSERRELGDGLRPGSPAVTLHWHRRPNRAFVTSLIGYVAGRLAGARATSIHDSDAGSFGVYNTRVGCWSERACFAANVGVSELPRVVRQVKPVFTGSPVHVAVGDQQSSLLGAGLKPGWLSVNVATGCQVSVLGDSFGDGDQTRPYFGSSWGGRFLKTVTHLPAGRYLASELRAARGFEDWKWLETRSGTSFHALNKIAEQIGEAAQRLDAIGLPVLFTGGLVQRIPGLRNKTLDSVGSAQADTFRGNDAALEGLAKLAI